MRHIAVLLLLTLSLTAAADDPKTFRSEFQAARKAAEEKDAKGYLEHMREAMELEHDRGGRPFYQYNLARALSMNGETAEAIATLEAIWNERIEGPMIMFADLDPAFEAVRAVPGYARIRGLFDALELELLPAGGSVVEISGAGCTLAASIGADGILLVDSGYPRITPSLLRALKKRAGDQARVRWVVTTHGHFDHAAANRAAGPDAVLVGHPAAAAEMGKPAEFVPGFEIPASPAASLPDLLVERGVTIRFNGENVRVAPLVAHSAGDLVVWFEGSRVLHMGDDYFGTDTTYLYPGADPASFYTALGEILAAVPDDAVVLSGHAPRVPASMLKAAFAKSQSLFTFVRDAVASGKKDEEITAEAEAQGHPGRWVRFYLGRVKKG